MSFKELEHTSLILMYGCSLLMSMGPMKYKNKIFTVASYFTEAFKYWESGAVFFFSYSSVDLSHIILYPFICDLFFWFDRINLTDLDSHFLLIAAKSHGRSDKDWTLWKDPETAEDGQGYEFPVVTGWEGSGNVAGRPQGTYRAYEVRCPDLSLTRLDLINARYRPFRQKYC